MMEKASKAAVCGNDKIPYKCCGTLTLLADQREIADGLLKYLSNFLHLAFFSPALVESHFSALH